MCRLCIRKTERGDELCLACRAAALDRQEAAARSDSGRIAGTISRGFSRPKHVRKHVVFLPVAIVTALVAMTVAAVPVLSGARGTRAEKRASDALHAIHLAETGSQRGPVKTYLTLDELLKKGFVSPEDIPGYDIKVELARDRHSFWARAIPTTPGLRGLWIDARGEIVVEQGD